MPDDNYTEKHYEIPDELRTVEVGELPYILIQAGVAPEEAGTDIAVDIQVGGGIEDNADIVRIFVLLLTRMAPQVLAANVARSVQEQRDHPPRPDLTLSPAELSALANLTQMYLDALDDDPSNERLTLGAAIMVSTLRDFLARVERLMEEQ